MVLKLVWGFCVLSRQTSILCIVGELAGGGSVALAVGVGDMLQVIYDTVLLSAQVKRLSCSSQIFLALLYSIV